MRTQADGDDGSEAPRDDAGALGVVKRDGCRPGRLGRKFGRGRGRVSGRGLPARGPTNATAALGTLTTSSRHRRS